MGNKRVRIRPTRGVYAIGALAAAFLIASRTTGAGWLTVLLAMATGLVAVGAIGPWLAIRRVTISAVAASDAVAGRPFSIKLAVDGPSSSIQVRLLKPASEWVGANVPNVGELQAIADRRGMIAQLVAEVSTASPVGLVWASRQIVVALPTPVAVAPRVEPVAFAVTTASPATGSEAIGRRVGAGETVRSIRDYRQGDSLRMIHWPATARLNQPMIKELESPDAPHLVVRLDLNCAPDEADQRAGIAYGHVQKGLAAGVPVRLLTAERSGPHGGAVGSMLEAGRRLAHATTGRPAELSEEERPVTIVNVP